MKLIDIGIQFRIGELVEDTPMFHDVVEVRNAAEEKSQVPMALSVHLGPSAEWSLLD